jgi:AcrR family transcriptional regulator
MEQNRPPKIKSAAGRTATASPMAENGATSRKRGRPRTYDPEAALAQAMASFWDAGYAGTSLDQLSDATGMNRPSLYGAFGDKKALYLKTLESYRELGRSAMAEALAGDDRLEAALRRVYARALDIYLSGPVAARGCYLIGTAATESVLDADIREVFAAGLHELDQQIAARARAAQRRGELDKGTEPEVLAKLAIGILNSLALRARAGETRAALAKMAEAGVRLLCGSH